MDGMDELDDLVLLKIKRELDQVGTTGPRARFDRLRMKARVGPFNLTSWVLLGGIALAPYVIAAVRRWR